MTSAPAPTVVSTVRSRFSRVDLLARAHRRRSASGRAARVGGSGWRSPARLRRGGWRRFAPAARRGRRCGAAAAASARSYDARNLASSGRPSCSRELLDLAGAVGERDRQHAGLAQAVDQRAGGVDVGRRGQAAEIDDHRRAREQLRRALHAVAHLARPGVDVEGADAQVGDADLADLEFAGRFVIDGALDRPSRAALRCAGGAAARRLPRAAAASQGTSGRASP